MGVQFRQFTAALALIFLGIWSSPASAYPMSTQLWWGWPRIQTNDPGDIDEVMTSQAGIFPGFSPSFDRWLLAARLRPDGGMDTVDLHNCGEMAAYLEQGYRYEAAEPFYGQQGLRIRDTLSSQAAECAFVGWLGSARPFVKTAFPKKDLDTSRLASLLPVGALLPDCLRDELLSPGIAPDAAASTAGIKYQRPKNGDPKFGAYFARPIKRRGKDATLYIQLNLDAGGDFDGDGWEDQVLYTLIWISYPIPILDQSEHLGTSITLVTRKKKDGPATVLRQYSFYCLYRPF